MKKKLIILTVGAVLINLLMLELFSMAPLNVIVSCLVILFAGVSVHFLLNREFKAAFRYSIGLLLPFWGIIEYIVALVMPTTIGRNWGLVTVILLLLFQSLLLTVTYQVSKKEY